MGNRRPTLEDLHQHLDVMAYDLAQHGYTAATAASEVCSWCYRWVYRQLGQWRPKRSSRGKR